MHFLACAHSTSPMRSVQMAIYGIGAMYGTDDMTDTFIMAGGAFIGWQPDEAPYAHNFMKRIAAGDIIFIKAYPPHMGLIVKAVGIADGKLRNDRVQDLGY